MHQTTKEQPVGRVPHALIIISFFFFLIFYCWLAARLKAFKTSFVDWKRKTATGCRVPTAASVCWRIGVVFPELSRFSEIGF